MKTNYREKPPRRCETCKYWHNYYANWLCMHGASKLPPTGQYVGQDDPVGHASIINKGEMEYYRKFLKERAVDIDGICDDYIRANTIAMKMDKEKIK